MIITLNHDTGATIMIASVVSKLLGGNDSHDFFSKNK